MRRAFCRAACLGLVSAAAFATWASAGAARGVPAAPLRVAVVIPKSGPFGIHNRSIANGATVATNEVNTMAAGKGHAPVHLQLKVVRVKPTASPQRIVRSLVRSSTRVLILPCNIQLQESLARAAAKAGLLSLSPCNPDATFGKHLARYWQTGPTGAAEVGQLVFYAQFLYRQRARRAFVLGAAHSWYSRLVMSELRAVAKRDKIKIVGQASVSGANGAVALASRIRKAEPGIVLTAIPSPAVESIITRLRANGLKTGFFVTDGMDAGINFRQYRSGPSISSLDNVIFASFGFPRSPGNRFSRDFAAAYGKAPVGSFPGLGFETVQVLETAAQQAATLTPAGLNASFLKGFTIKGLALEDITYRGHGHRQPVTYVGMAEVVRDGYAGLFTAIAGHPVG